ncbi:alpha/beta hydrolase [Engelhardtia mirabilis]|uniref:Alpha/beta hydrolase family protein n=1 Tax=Engelhardtia mirabilis TaxID=2528011 RepID=A0A518BEH7_9BACT|nr:Alpha/beta hydrolase family protein [Planctomycetes bacterium Pla133]QDU99720.1 Alpha/beta hydrolase family protein [Planctomycetes bacterium Pla86]
MHSEPLIWTDVDAANGVVLRSTGEGLPLFLFPGMEGDGSSCLHLAQPAVEQAIAAGAPTIELVVVDFSAERHASLEALVGTCSDLVRGHLQRRGAESCLVWGQSFGNLLAAVVAPALGARVDGCVLFSPFSALPAGRTRLASLAMAVTPTFLYRAVIGRLGRLAFGPTGDGVDHGFFAGLRRMTAGQVRRRTGWLRSRKFADRFARLEAPARVWLGARDRLIDLEEQRRFFGELSRRRPGWSLHVLDSCGHVVLPSPIVTAVRRDLALWLVECAERAQGLRSVELRPPSRTAAPIRSASTGVSVAEGDVSRDDPSAPESPSP